MKTILTKRLFPSRRPTDVISTPLSILDATVARFAPAGCIWVFDNHSINNSSTPGDSTGEDVFLERLEAAFVETLNAFPQWAGQLGWASFRQGGGGGHTERFHRPRVVYGEEGDPGVGWTVVRHEEIQVESLAPTPGERAASGSGKGGVWVADGFPQDSLLSGEKLALYNLRDYEGLAGMLVQVNLFAEGKGFAIGIKMAHPLADAQALMVFVHRWAAVSRGMDGHDDSSLMGGPVFEPGELDRRAAGDIDAATADPSLIAAARELPLHRFDWWGTTDPGYPAMLIPTTENGKPPADVLEKANLSPSTPGPWRTWGFTRPVTQVQFHFSGQELSRLQVLAREDPRGRPDISRLDALLAHLWAAINRARGHTQSKEEVFLNITLGARQRVSPALPDTFLGSPIFLTHIQSTGTEACTASTGETATKIRETVQLFTPEKIGALLHDTAHELAPHRLWQAFLGTQHTLVTSWLRLRLYQVDFDGRGEGPRYVHAVMPKMDGCVQVMDPGVDDGGIDVAMNLEAEAMERLLRDQTLRVM